MTTRVLKQFNQYNLADPSSIILIISSRHDQFQWKSVAQEISFLKPYMTNYKIAYFPRFSVCLLSIGYS